MADLTDQLRYAWCWYGGASRPESDERAAAFDAWLAAHDRQVRAQALREAAADCNCEDDWALLRDRADAEERGDQ